MITVTKTFLPPLAEYLPYLEQVWETAWVTTQGPLVCELTRQLAGQLDTSHLLYVANGTTALQVAIQALDLAGEVITTPFSFVATTAAIAWTGRKPVLVDIDPETLNIDPQRVEEAITSRTSAILATHVYGYPCDVHALQEIADRHQLPLIFDAAAGFAVRYQGRPLVQYGDVSTLSFHATKVFHSVEGGAVVTSEPSIHDACLKAHNHGLLGGDRGFQGLGSNAKNSELHAAMGLAVLPYVPELIAHRRALSEAYDRRLAAGECLKRPKVRPTTEYNYTYYPVIFPSEESLLQAQSALAEQQIMGRRYFYPSLTTLEYIDRFACPVADRLARCVLCLPLSHAMSLSDAEMVAAIVLRCL